MTGNEFSCFIVFVSTHLIRLLELEPMLTILLLHLFNRLVVTDTELVDQFRSLVSLVVMIIWWRFTIIGQL